MRVRLALKPLADVFSELILQDQDCFRSPEQAEALLKLLTDKGLVEELREQWGDEEIESSKRWEDMKKVIKKIPKDTPRRVRRTRSTFLNVSLSAIQAKITAAIEDIILQYTYPRLDAEVSKHRNHLLKAPFCIHPKTGRVCVPVDPANIETFDPEKVPTVFQLLKELDSSAAENTENGDHRAGTCFDHNSLVIPLTSMYALDWERTSLKPYVDMLDKHAMALMEEVRRGKRERGAGACIWIAFGLSRISALTSRHGQT